MWCCDISRLPLDARVCSGPLVVMARMDQLRFRRALPVLLAYVILLEAGAGTQGWWFSIQRSQIKNYSHSPSTFYFHLFSCYEVTWIWKLYNLSHPKKEVRKNIGIQDGCVVPPTVDEGMPFEEHNLFGLARQELNRWCTVLKMM